MKYRHPYCRGVPDRETTVEGNMDGVLGVEEANFKMGSPLDIEPTFLESGPWNQEGRSALDEELACLRASLCGGLRASQLLRLSVT